MHVRVAQLLGLERGLLLVRLLANLHFYLEGACAPELKVCACGGWSVCG